MKTPDANLGSGLVHDGILIDCCHLGLIVAWILIALLEMLSRALWNAHIFSAKYYQWRQTLLLFIFLSLSLRLGDERNYPGKIETNNHTTS